MVSRRQPPPLRHPRLADTTRHDTARRDPGMLDISTVDYHAAGEPFRIVSSGIADKAPLATPGLPVAERRVRAMADPETDRLRRFLCLEPRGHADMYGGFITPPDDEGADFGV